MPQDSIVPRKNRHITVQLTRCLLEGFLRKRLAMVGEGGKSHIDPRIMQTDFFKGRGGALLKIDLVVCLPNFFFLPILSKRNCPVHSRPQHIIFGLQEICSPPPLSRLLPPGQGAHNVGSPGSSPWDLGSFALKKKPVPTLAVEQPHSSQKIGAHAPPWYICSYISPADGCVPVRGEEARVPRAKDTTRAKVRPQIQP